MAGIAAITGIIVINNKCGGTRIFTGGKTPSRIR